MPIVIVRHAERVDYVTEGWTQSADKPWDTPITEHGYLQSQKAGAHVVKLCHQHSLPPVSRVITSPLTRCVETAAHIIKGIATSTKEITGTEHTISLLDMDPSLSEAICRKWYQSWAFKGISDSTWGGPKNFDWSALAEEDLEEMLHERATDAAHTLHLTHSDADVVLAKVSQRIGVPIRINTEYQPHIGPAELDRFTYGVFESEEHVMERMAGLCHKVDRPDTTTVLVTHGGPSGSCFSHLTGQNYVSVGFTCVHVLVQDPNKILQREKGWQALVVADTSHLEHSADNGLATAGRV